MSDQVIYQTFSVGLHFLLYLEWDIGRGRVIFPIDIHEKTVVT